MNATPKAIGEYVAGGLIVIGFVVLFSIIFSFVGTIICAALAGMMMGAARFPWWQSFALSVVFPAVICTLFLVTRAGLPLRQVLFVSLLCLAVFWVIYFALWALTSTENAVAKGSMAGGTSDVAARRPTASSLRIQGGLAAAPAAPASPCPTALMLEILQGDWLSSNSNLSSSGQKRIEVCDHTIVLTLTDADGHIRQVAKAQLRLCGECARASGTEAVGLAPQAQVCV